MTEEERQDARDDLDLEAETIKDLEPNLETADDVLGGATRATNPGLGQFQGSHST